MPSENRVGSDDRGDVPEHPASKAMSQFGETAPLVIIKPQAPSLEPRLQHPVLFSQERDDGVLLPLKPSHSIATKKGNGNTPEVYVSYDFDPLMGQYGCQRMCSDE
jgi:hypothetical protein